MLTELVLDDWKSFGPNTTIKLAPLTVFVGPNAAGKSNVFDALRFVQGLALGLPIDDVLRGRSEGGRETWAGIRGGPQEAARVSASAFSIGTSWKNGWHHRVEIETRPLAAVRAESLTDTADAAVFDTHAGSLGGNVGRTAGGGLNVAVRKGPGSGRWPSVVLRDSASVVTQLQPDSRFGADVFSVVQGFSRTAREMTFLDIQPHEMRGPSPIGRGIGLSGEHVASAVHLLPASVRQDVADWLSELVSPRVRDLKTELVSSVQEVFLFLEEADGTRISARSMSDGTLRFLGTLVALLTTPEGSTVLLEEPDVGLHPARVHLLAQFLEQVTAQRKIQVLATSHSPTLLSHLSDDAFLNVVAFDRDDESGVTVAHRIGDLPNHEVLLPPEKRSPLISTGWLEMAS